MKLILNDIKYLSLKDISFYKNRINYQIQNFKMNGLYIKIKKKMIENDNKYIVYLTEDIILLNELIEKEYKSFICNTEKPSIEVVKNNITQKIYNDNEKYLILGFMSINENNYPRIHILPCQENRQENQVENQVI